MNEMVSSRFPFSFIVDFSILLSPRAKGWSDGGYGMIICLHGSETGWRYDIDSDE